MQWAVGSGVSSGKPASTFAPKDTATRTEIAVIMMQATNIPPCAGKTVILNW